MSTSPLAPSQPKNAQWKAHLADWAKYAAAAGAALSMATSADASIIHGEPNQTIGLANLGSVFSSGTGKAATFGLGGAQIWLRGTVHWDGASSIRNGTAGVNGLHVFNTSGFNQGGHALRFGTGQAIGGAHLAYGGVLRSAHGRTGHGLQSGSGNFNFNATGIVGFTVLGGDLGWMKVKVGDRNSDGFPDQLTIISWAYNDQPGQSITAGQAPSATPEPGTAALGLLAAGASGILALRRRRKEIQGN